MWHAVRLQPAVLAFHLGAQAAPCERPGKMVEDDPGAGAPAHVLLALTGPRLGRRGCVGGEPAGGDCFCLCLSLCRCLSLLCNSCK